MLYTRRYSGFTYKRQARLLDDITSGPLGIWFCSRIITLVKHYITVRPGISGILPSVYPMAIGGTSHLVGRFADQRSFDSMTKLGNDRTFWRFRRLGSWSVSIHLFSERSHSTIRRRLPSSRKRKDFGATRAVYQRGERLERAKYWWGNLGLVSFGTMLFYANDSSF